MAKISPEELGFLKDEALRGVGADTILKTLGPAFDTRLEQLLQLLDNAAPELEILLDLRSQIKTLRSLRRELVTTSQTGKHADGKLQKQF